MKEYKDSCDLCFSRREARIYPEKIKIKNIYKFVYLCKSCWEKVSMKRKKNKIICKCGYKGEPSIVYENKYYVWYCPKCGIKQS